MTVYSCVVLPKSGQANIACGHTQLKGRAVHVNTLVVDLGHEFGVGTKVSARRTRSGRQTAAFERKLRAARVHKELGGFGIDLPFKSVVFKASRKRTSVSTDHLSRGEFAKKTSRANKVARVFSNVNCEVLLIELEADGRVYVVCVL